MILGMYQLITTIGKTKNFYTNYSYHNAIYAGAERYTKTVLQEKDLKN